nr:MAG TPA: hypothetical protein [Inoviridae sp.]
MCQLLFQVISLIILITFITQEVPNVIRRN